MWENSIAIKQSTHLRQSEQQRNKTEQETTHKHSDRYNCDSQPSIHDDDFFVFFFLNFYLQTSLQKRFWDGPFTSCGWLSFVVTSILPFHVAPPPPGSANAAGKLAFVSAPATPSVAHWGLQHHPHCPQCNYWVKSQARGTPEEST